MHERPFLLVDGLNLFMRHFVVNPTLSESGDHVGGIVGFLRALAYLCNRTAPKRVIIAWEGGGSPRRLAYDPNYKRKRRPKRLNRYYSDDIPDTVENRNYQIATLISILKNVPVTQIYINDCEADDIIGYITKNLIKTDCRCVIASSDKDLYQLLSKNVIQWSPGQKKFINMKDVLEKFGISCENFCTARCFIGDSSDGIKGVRLAGFSSMAKRFPELSGEKFVSVEEIVKKSADLMQSSKLKLYKNIVEEKQQVSTNWKIMYLGISNLSYDQIEKIKFSFENIDFRCNKLSVIKNMNKVGIKNFDIDSFFSSLSALRNNNARV
jgi:DNA polymerase-1